MINVDQLVFGYDQGHRLLAGSRPLDRASLSRLLGATDAAPANDRDALLTGLPLPDEGLYALSMTWTAPEVTRPGAVWAHVLLLSFDQLGEAREPMSLRALLRRPTPETLDDYRRTASWVDRPMTNIDVPDDTLRSLVAAEYGASSSRVVIVPKLAPAELAFGLIWRTQWPALRNTFEFRTRDVARMATSGQAVVATRRIQGKRPIPVSTARDWTEVLTSSLAGGPPRNLPSFLLLFGPDDSTSPETTIALTRIFQHVDHGKVEPTARSLESRYPTSSQGRQIKIGLFGPDDKIWQASETDRLISIIGTHTDAWPLKDLKLVPRLERWLREVGPDQLRDALGTNPTDQVSEAVVDALVARDHPADFATFVDSCSTIAERWLDQQPHIADDAEAWRGADPSQVADLLRTFSRVPPSTITALISAGHSGPVLDQVGEEHLIAELVEAREWDLLSKLAKDVPGRLTEVQSDRARLAILVVAADLLDQPTAASTLRAERASPDELWLRAAVSVLISRRFDRSDTLEIVFGPLHNAVTADRLPRELWETLGTVTPPANDPALRLRRLLIQTARDESWSPDRILRTIDGAGPFASELRADVQRSDKHQDDWWVDAMKTVFRAVGWRWR